MPVTDHLNAMRPIALCPLLLLAVGSDLERLVQLKASASPYELEAKTEIKSGIRPYAVTQYTYYQRENGERRELWSVTQGDKYFRHWISPSGRVWVATSSMPGPGGTGAIWTRDAHAARATGVGYETVLPPHTEGGVVYATQSLASVDLDRVTALTFGLNGYSEQLRLPLKDGGEGRVTLITTDNGGQIGLAKPLAKGERDLLTENLEASPSNLPNVSRPVARSPLVLWQVRDEKSGRTHRILQTLQQATSGNSIEGRVTPVMAEREVELAPAVALRTPGGRVLWFGFSQPGEEDAARLSVMNYDGALLKEFDLVKLGGFQNAQEAREKLAYRDVRIHQGDTFLPLNDIQDQFTTGPEELELRDEKGRTLIKIDDAKVSAERLTGLASRRPKEGLSSNAHILAERDFLSPDGRFKLRERRVKNGGLSDIYFETFLGLTNESDGKCQFVELWSNVHGSPIAQAKVTDSGRTFVVRTEPGAEGEPQRAVMMVNGPDGNQYAGIDLYQSPASFKTASEALKSIDLKEMEVSSKGNTRALNIEGVSYRVPVQEQYRLPLGRNRIWTFFIGSNASPTQEGVWWREPAITLKPPTKG